MFMKIINYFFPFTKGSYDRERFWAHHWHYFFANLPLATLGLGGMYLTPTFSPAFYLASVIVLWFGLTAFAALVSRLLAGSVFARTRLTDKGSWGMKPISTSASFPSKANLSIRFRILFSSR